MARKPTFTEADLVRVDELEGNETIRGTSASGPYEDGPRTLVQVDEVPPKSPFHPDFRLWFDDGRALIYFGSTKVIVGR